MIGSISILKQPLIYRQLQKSIAASGTFQLKLQCLSFRHRRKRSKNAIEKKKKQERQRKRKRIIAKNYPEYAFKELQLLQQQG